MDVDATFDWVGSARGVPALVCLLGACFEPSAPRDTVSAVVAQIDAAAAGMARAHREADAGAADAAEVATLPTAKILWERLYERLGAACFMAAAVATPAPARAALVEILQAWARSPFAEEPSRFRCLWGIASRPSPLDEHPQFVRMGAGGALLVKRVTWSADRSVVSVLERDVGRQLRGLPDLRIESEVRGSELRTNAASLRGFLARVRDEGPPPHDARVPRELAARTGLGEAAAALLWAACVEHKGDVRVDVQPDVRKALGLRVKDVAGAEPTLRRLHVPRQPSRMSQWYNVSEPVMPYQAFYDLYEEAVEDPNELYAPLGAGPGDDRSLVARLARACLSRPWLTEVGAPGA